MGIRKYDLEVIRDLIGSKKWQMKGLKMLQLGDQSLRDQNNTPALDYFEDKGVEIISIDISGKNGSIPIDLNQRISWTIYKNYFDLITNFGTLEHVKDDLIGYANVNYFLRKGGVVINISPWVDGQYTYHRKAHKYTTQFYTDWCNKYNYKILVNKVLPKEDRGANWILAILQKN